MTNTTTRIPYIWTLCVVCVLYVSIKLLRFGRREKHLPPGPPTIPILGNAHQIVGKNLHRNVYSLKIGKGTMVVLYSKRAVHELVDKRSAIYSERPREQQVIDTLRHENVGAIDANPVWKAQRKIAVQFLTPTKLDGEIAKIFEAEISKLMYDLLIGPEDFKNYIKRCTASAAAIVLYGQRATSYDDFWATGVYRTMEIVNKSLEPGSYPPSEQFPIFKLIPDRWNPAKARAADSFQTTSTIFLESVARVEQRRNHGDKRDSLLDKMLDGDIKSEVPMVGTQFANFFGALMQAAADTSAIAMLTHIMFLAQHPEVQAKARAELDKVCGTERMPTWHDFKAIPYINCIMKEGLRISPVVPIGVAHRVKQDDWYEGMLIPKDAMIMIPSWALGRSQYKDPDTYNPDRYMNHPRLAMDYAGSPDYENRDHYAYGAGRRICAGINLAERTQWRILSRLLWGFNVERLIDEETGQPIDIDTEAYEDGLVPEPKPYRVKITPRSEKHAEIIRRDFGNIEEFLKKWE
ncbi:hypothetical protein N0V90_008673 [Kalmusia sp. IMI 367209]|nr:hypothetical protein N0V90_008673 [Kalmusia sp. IMI 367209]